jgi:16S rRNA (cytosine967-C5)-methyltransferase
MTPAARISAAIEVLADILDRRRPAPDALKDWGLSHRFAGSGDRAAIAGVVYDALRRKASASWIMGSEAPRAIVLGMLRLERKLDISAVERLCDVSRFAPEPLSEAERMALSEGSLVDAPAHVRGDYPEWLDPHLAEVFGEQRAAEGEALASRAPLDLRANSLKADRERVIAALAHLNPHSTPWSPDGLRIALGADARSPAVHAEPAFLKGWVEVQDEGSQLAALFAAPQPGEQVIDLCAGAGGKTLALAAAMANRGQIFATDLDKRRLAPLHARVERAGARNIQVRTPTGPARKAGETSYGNDATLAGLTGTADLVLVDAPCTGTGAWRRNPDAKWRMRPTALERRTIEQREVLDRAAALVRPGGRIAYVTCSVLDAENGARVRDFLARHDTFGVMAATEMVATLGDRAQEFAVAALMSADGLLMTPQRTRTDGFFVALLRRAR